MKRILLLILLGYCIPISVYAQPNPKSSPPVRIDSPPAKFREGILGARNHVRRKDFNDSLWVYSSVFASKDSSFKIDHLYSVVEIYTLRDSLLYRFEKSTSDTNEVVQDLRFYPWEADTIKIRSWGFGYDLYNQNDTTVEYKRMIIATTPLYLQVLPDTANRKSQDKR